MKTHLTLFLFIAVLFAPSTSAQRSKAIEEAERRSPNPWTESIQDRAGGTHNKSNFSWFFENRGKLYPRRVSQGFGAEWPIGSQHEYVYRANPMIGIPGNVVQGRFTTDEEWEAAYGYNNRDSAKIAFSDNPGTWPPTGWIVKNASGKAVFVSNQDSYCVYNDSGNTNAMLGLQVNQIGYAFSQKKVKDIVYFTFLVINKSPKIYDSLYFGIYADIDVGNVSGGEDEFSDDAFTFNKTRELMTYYDTKGYSREWLTPSGQFSPTGYFGMAFLETPSVNGKQLGITDMHYNTNGSDDDFDIDSVLYGIMSSAPSLYASPLSSLYFHLGANAPNLHIDDIKTIPPTGTDVVTWTSSGPYRIGPGDTLRFVTAWIAGLTSQDYDSVYAHCKQLYDDHFVISQPPPTPKVTVVPGDKRVTILWDNRSELTRDQLTGKNTFAGYRLYKSIDQGLHWDQIDRNVYPAAGADPVPLATFNRKDADGNDIALQYSYVDTGLTNGFEYWYSVTAFSRDQSGQVMETARGNTAQEINIGVATPRWNSIGRTPVTWSDFAQVGTGSAKVICQVAPADLPQAGDRTYEISFAPVTAIQQGTFTSVISASADTIGPWTNDLFSITFRSPSSYRLRDLSRGVVLDSAGVYTSGAPIHVEGLRLTITDTSSQTTDKPATGDSLLICTGVQITSGGAVELLLQSFSYDTRYVTASSVIVALSRADIDASSAVTYRDKFSFKTTGAVVDQAKVASELSRVRVVPNPYLVSSQYEQEYGSLRREPIRQLKFTNLPPKCTIYILTLDGDKVKTIQHNSSDGSETWDLRAAGGREIVAGVYLYLVKTETAEKLDRFAVIK